MDREELRFDLTLTLDGSTEKVNTFTWGRTYNEAYARVTDTLDDADGFWDGWSFKLSKTGVQA